MARKKTTKASSKSTGSTKKTSSRSAASKNQSRKRTSSKWSPQKSRRSQKQTTKRTAKPIREGLSLDRKLDIVGIAFTLLGVLTLLSLLSPIRSTITGTWVNFLAMVFGLGMYLFSFGLILGGVWLVLRNYEKIPQFAVERIIGLILFFLNLLVFMHYFSLIGTEFDIFALARAGKGGGYVGAGLLEALNRSLGVGGTVIALAAWLLIALALSFDVTVLEMMRWFPPLFERLQDWFIETTEELRTRKLKSGQVDTELKPFHEGAVGEGTLMSPSSLTSSGTFGSDDPTVIPRTWILPDMQQILDEGGDVNFNDEVDLQRARVIEETLSSFGAPARVVEINRGPTITQFGVEPDYVESRGGRMRVRVSKITALADDLALALSARTIRIQAPVPGKGFVGLEVPNEEISLVALRDLIQSEAFKRLKSPLRFALGLNVSGNAVAADLSVMPHLLVAGATGSGKSVCVNAIISCLLIHNTPDDLRLIMIDPKRVELTNYNGIPHLLAPVVVELERVVTVLQWVTREMDMRYRKLAEAGCRNIQEYNAKQVAKKEKKLPYLVVIIDELADLMMLAPDETERTITRLAQLARATGIHLIIATQRPSVDVVTGLIKANFPARIAFAVASGVDSRVILDQPGAERLLGRGDMLFQAPDAPAPVRLQGVFVSDMEIQRLVTYWQEFMGITQTVPTAAGGIVDAVPSGIPLKQIPMWEEIEEDQNKDPLYDEAVDLIRRQGRASISMLQRRLRIGYTRAGRLIEEMEARGIIGPPEPSTGAREVLDYGPAAPPVDDA